MPDHEATRHIFLRRLLVFWVIFGLIASLLGACLVMYALGYRYDLKRKKLVLVSVLYINSRPQGAEVYINNNYLGNTKLILPKIIPGTYHLVLKKEGFFDWSTDVEIEPYSLVEISPALFYRKPQIVSTLNSIKIVAIHPYWVIYESPKGVFVVNLVDLDTRYKLNSQSSKPIVFSPSGEYVAQEDKGQWQVWNKQTVTKISKPDLPIKKWSVSDRGTVYFLTSDQKLWSAETNKQTLIASKVKDFQVIQNKLWLITTDGDLSFFNFNLEKVAQKTMEVQNDSLAPIKINSLSFCNFNLSRLVCLRNEQGYFILSNNKLFWLGKDVKSITENGKEFGWLNAEGDIYFFKDNQTVFVTRYFNTPEQIEFFSPQYLLLRYPHKVKMLELETKQEFPVFESSSAILKAKAVSDKEITVVTTSSIQKAKITEASSLWQKVLQTLRK